MLYVFLVGCADIDPLLAAETVDIQDISVGVSAEMGTVLEVGFTTSTAGTGWAEYRTSSDEAWRTAPAVQTGGTSHTALIAGLKPLSEVEIRLVGALDGQRKESLPFTATTELLPTQTPALVVTVDDYADQASGYLLMSIGGMSRYLIMVDLDGDTVWSLPSPGADTITMGTAPDPAGGGFLFNEMGSLEKLDTVLYRVGLDGALAEEIDLSGAHHFFTTHPDGTIGYLAADVRDTEEWGLVQGDRLMERAPDGTVTELFSLWDHLYPEGTSLTWDEGLYGEDVRDWSHGNGIHYSEQSDSYLVSLGGINRVLEIDQDGELLRTMGGMGVQDADLHPAAEQTFAFPHNPTWSDSGELMLFSTVDGVSRGERYRLGQSMESVASFGVEQGMESIAMGDCRQLPDGMVLVGWGMLGMVQIYSPEGALLWEAHTDLGQFPTEIRYLPTPY